VNSLPLLAPLFLVFEIWQLFMSERYVGTKQIARGTDPREMGPHEAISFVWSISLLIYGAWMVALLAIPNVRIYALFLLAATALGYPIRRNCRLRWILIVLTCEGGVRIGFLFALSYVVWRPV
jgi:hypothetical protein